VPDLRTLALGGHRFALAAYFFFDKASGIEAALGR